MVPGSIVATDHAFAGVMVGPDKTALAWGHKDYGGLVPPDFACAISRDIEAIYAINDTFAALTTINGKRASGDLAKSRRNPRLCHAAKRIIIWAKLNSRRNRNSRLKCAFAALLANGSVVSFGWAGVGVTARTYVTPFPPILIL